MRISFKTVMSFTVSPHGMCVLFWSCKDCSPSETSGMDQHKLSRGAQLSKNEAPNRFLARVMA